MTDKNSSNDATTTSAATPPSQVVHHPHSSSLPQTLTRSFLVLGKETDAWIQIFSDRIFVGVSQLDGKIGTYLMCEAETSEINPRQMEYHISTLLGNREDAMLGVYARTLMERIQAFQESEGGGNNNSANSKLPVLLLGISLDREKGNSPEMFRNLVNILLDMYVDAVRDDTAKE